MKWSLYIFSYVSVELGNAEVFGRQVFQCFALLPLWPDQVGALLHNNLSNNWWNLKISYTFSLQIYEYRYSIGIIAEYASRIRLSLLKYFFFLKIPHHFIFSLVFLFQQNKNYFWNETISMLMRDALIKRFCKKKILFLNKVGSTIGSNWFVIINFWK